MDYLSLAVGFLTAILAAGIGAGAVLLQTRKMLAAESENRKSDAEREIKSLAVSLLAEVDDFYKLFIRDFLRQNKHAGGPSETSRVKSSTYKAFVVFEANSDKVGMFDPPLVQAVVAYYGTVRAYLNTLADLGQAQEQWGAGDPTGRPKAMALFSQTRNGAEKLVPPTKSLCALLAERAGTTYTFEEP
jgi:hypothetical protein